MDMYIGKDKDNKKHIFREIVNYLLTIIVAFALAFFVVNVFVQTNSVVGDSMSPTLSDNDEAVLLKSAYFISKPKRYDVVKFTITRSEVEHVYIKRIIGLPKETVQIKDGALYVDDKKLDDCPITDAIASAGIADEPVKLGDDEYFVIGDNCNNSEDSRFTNVGAVTKEEIDGKIIGIIKDKKYVSIYK